MIAERLQHFVRSLHDLTDGKPRKLVFFRIGGVSSSSRIEYDVSGSMVSYSPEVKTIDTQVIRYLKGALDVEVVKSKGPAKAGTMRLDLFLVIWKSLANIGEDDAEQLFFGEAEIGIQKSKGRPRIKDTVRSSFSRLLLDYYDSNPKPIQSFFVDHPEKDAESFYRELLMLLVVGELDCISLVEHKPKPAPPPPPPVEKAKAAAPSAAAPQAEKAKPVQAKKPDPVPEEPRVVESVEAQPAASQNEDDYISSLINTASLRKRASKRSKKKKKDASHTNGSAAGVNGTSSEEIPSTEDIDLLQESIVDEDAQASNGGLMDDFGAFDTPLETPEETPEQKEKKIAGLKRLLNAAKKGF